MTFSLRIFTREIASALAACSHIADANSKIPILKATRIEISDGTARFMATNSEQTIVVRAACEGHGVACVDTAALHQKIQALRPAEVVSIEGDGKQVTITQGRTKWKVPVMLDDWPINVIQPVKGDAVKVGREFMGALTIAKAATLPSATTNYAGVWIDSGHVLAVNGREFRAIESATLPSCVISTVTVDKATTLFKDGAEVTVGEYAIQFSTDFLTLKSNLLQLKAADWKTIMERIRSTLVHSCIADASTLAACMKRAAAIGASGEKSGSFINMQVRFREGEIGIYTRNLLGEEGNDDNPCEGGGEADIGVNGGLIIAALETLSGPVRLSYGTARDAIILEPAGSDQTNIRAVFPRVFS